MISNVLDRARAASAATPAHRDRFIDFLRVASLLVVVLGHWTMATIIVGDDGGVRGANALAAMPYLQPLTWVLQVMPLFFVAGGFANATVWSRVRRGGGDYAEYLHARLTRLVRPVLVFVAVAYAGLGVARWAGLSPDLVELVGGLLGQPLWFLGVYVVVTAAAPAMWAWHRRQPVVALGALAAAAVTVDLVRLAGATEVGYLNLAFVWLVAAQLGFWYVDGRLQRLSRPVLWAVVTAAVATLVLLTGPGPYAVSMVGLPGEVSNMSPPTVCLLVLTFGQAAAAMLVRRRIVAWLERPRAWAAVVAVGAMAMTIYVWHLAVLVAGFGVLLWLGLSMPEAATPWWWVTRPVWFAGLAAILVVVATWLARWERPAREKRAEAERPAAPRPAATVIAATGAALAAVGLLGFVVSGVAPAPLWSSTLLVVPVDPVQNTILVVAGLLLAKRAAGSAHIARPHVS